MSELFTINNQAVQQEVATLLDQDAYELEYLLGLRVKAIQENIELSLKPTFEVAESTKEVSLPPWVYKTVESMINAALRQSHSVLCSDAHEYADIRNQLKAALGLGGTAAVLTFTAFLTSTLGLAAALASIVATIIIKKIGKPALRAGHQTMCAELAKLLP